MLRRVALKNIGLITGGAFFLPYSCDFNPDFIYSNFPKLKRKEKSLIASICEVIFLTNLVNGRWPNRVQCILKMLQTRGFALERFCFHY